MKEQPVAFECGNITLEGLLAVPAAGTRARGAVVCHPHPQYGGSMHNNVVEAILEALWSLGFATLRFNFRGVGSSGGEYSGGAGEVLDAKAAVRFLAAQPSVLPGRTLLAGYSFGALVALRAGAELDEVSDLVAVAPPVGMMDLSFIAGLGKRIVLIAGDRDPYCPAGQLKALHARMGASASLKSIGGADHFFGGYESELSSVIARELGRVAG